MVGEREINLKIFYGNLIRCNTMPSTASITPSPEKNIRVRISRIKRNSYRQKLSKMIQKLFFAHEQRTPLDEEREGGGGERGGRRNKRNILGRIKAG